MSVVSRLWYCGFVAPFARRLARFSVYTEEGIKLLVCTEEGLKLLVCSDEGLKLLVCCEEGPISGAYRGNTHTGMRQVRVTPSNSLLLKASYTRSLRPHTLGAYGLIH